MNKAGLVMIRILPPDVVMGSVEAQRQWATEVSAVLRYLAPIDPARVLVTVYQDLPESPKGTPAPDSVEGAP